MTRALLSLQGVWQRWRDLKSTADIARDTGQPEHEVAAAVHLCREAYHSGAPMPWIETYNA